jgi:hypothetical protein
METLTRDATVEDQLAALEAEFLRTPSRTWPLPMDADVPAIELPCPRPGEVGWAGPEARMTKIRSLHGGCCR